MATALFLAGSAISVGGQVLGAIGARNQAAFEADVARTNAINAQNQAAAEAVREERAGRRRMSQTKAAFGASGVQMEGSPLEVLGDSAMEEAENVALIRHGGRGRAAEFRNQATAAGMRGTSALVGGLGRAGGSLLSAAGTFKRDFSTSKT
jgi:hypothetical protein